MNQNNATEGKTQPQLGLTLVGPWQTCRALRLASDRGSLIFEESELCRIVGIAPEQLDGWLTSNWREQNLKGGEQDGVYPGNNISLVRELGGGSLSAFSVRLFSLLEPDAGMMNLLRSKATRRFHRGVRRAGSSRRVYSTRLR